MTILHDPCTTASQRRYFLDSCWRLANQVDRKRKQTSQQIDPNAAFHTAEGGLRAVCFGCRRAYDVEWPFWNQRAIESLESRNMVPVSKKRSAVLCSECTPRHDVQARCSNGHCGVWLQPKITCSKNQMRGNKVCFWCQGMRHDLKLSDEEILALLAARKSM